MHTDEQQRDGPRPPRPPAKERYAAAVEIASGGAAALRRHARRYSLCAADAEDACQRGLEILLTKAPTAEHNELRAWLHTVVKHEALALRRQRERALVAAEPDQLAGVSGHTDGPDERAGGRERARQAAEALTHLKPSELRCMLLKAAGYSYEEIGLRTGYSYTKVNRSLTEGRRRFKDRFEKVTSGSGCAELEPLLSAASDGECSPQQVPRLRVHLQACPSCRAKLRGFREAPGRLAELLPPALLLPVLDRGGWWSRMAAWIETGPAERVAALSQKLHGSSEMLGAKKAAVVVASTAALAGGAAVEEQVAHPRGAIEHRAQAREVADKDQAGEAPAAVPVAVRDPVTPVSRPETAEADSDSDAGEPGAREFSFEHDRPSNASLSIARPAQAAANTEPSPRGSDQAGSEQFTPVSSGGGSGTSAAAGGAEFGP